MQYSVAMCYCRNHLVREFDREIDFFPSRKGSEDYLQLSSLNRKLRKAKNTFVITGCLLGLFDLIHQIVGFVYDLRK